MKPTLSQVCSLSSSFETDIEEYGAGGCRSIEVWLTKLENYLERHSLEDVQALCREHEVELNAASFQGGLLTTQGEARNAAWDLFERRLGVCSQLNISTIVLACDVLAPVEQQDVDRARASLAQAARAAGSRGVRVALEFQSRSAFGNNLQTAAALVDEVGSPHLGICLDIFHFYNGPSKFSDLAYLNAKNLFHVQLSDLVDVPREFATDADRIIPGDGDFEILPIIEHLRRFNYAGCISIELMNPQIWQVSARQFGDVGANALNRLLNDSSS